MYLSQLPFCPGLENRGLLLFLGTVAGGWLCGSGKRLSFSQPLSLFWTMKEFVLHEIAPGLAGAAGVTRGSTAYVTPCHPQPVDLRG